MDFSNIKSDKVYALVDCDSFFASCEVFRNPKLRSKPVCVWGDIIVAATYEAKSYWIKTWTPIWEAKRILWKSGIFLKPDIKFYWRISSKIMDFLEKFSNWIEVFSIDEAFIDITSLDKVYNIPYPKLVEFIKIKIHREIWIPVSIGSANTKLLAKIFAKLNKPYGTFCLFDEADIDYYLKQIDSKEIPFIWRASFEKIKYIAPTIFDFKSLDYKQVKYYLQWPGLKIWFELNWIDVMNFAHLEYPKMITRSRSFNPDFTNEYDVLMSRFMNNFDKAFEYLNNLKMKIKYLKVFLRHKDFSKSKAEYIFPYYTNDKNIIVSKVKEMFDFLYDRNIFYRSTGIVFWNLIQSSFTQYSLFNENKDREILRKIINNINYKFWKNVIWSASNILNKSESLVLWTLIWDVKS